MDNSEFRYKSPIIVFRSFFFQVIDSIHKFIVIIDNRIFPTILFFENFNCLKFVI